MMKPSENASIALALCGVILLPFTLQTVGLFSPHWVSISTCDSVGLIYSCCSGPNNDTCENTNGGDELDMRVLGLEAASFTVMLLVVIVFVFWMWHKACDNEEEEWCGIACCCLLLLTVAGLFSFIGCMVIVSDYSSAQLGWSFFLCLVSGCYVFLVTIIFSIWSGKQMFAIDDEDCQLDMVNSIPLT